MWLLHKAATADFAALPCPMNAALHERHCLDDERQVFRARTLAFSYARAELAVSSLSGEKEGLCEFVHSSTTLAPCGKVALTSNVVDDEIGPSRAAVFSLIARAVLQQPRALKHMSGTYVYSVIDELALAVHRMRSLVVRCPCPLGSTELRELLCIS